MAGEYRNDEAETTLRVAAEADTLVIYRRPNGFNSTLGSVRFIRSVDGKITELRIGEQRVWDIRFQRSAR